MKVVAGFPAKTKRKENSLALVPRIGGMSSADDDEQEDDE
jgi:hypothetical protein